MNKKDYFNQVFNSAKRKLLKANVKPEEIDKFSGLFNTMLAGDDIFSQLYLVMQIKKLENFGKYLLYISKKLDEKIIDGSNIYGNINSDSDFLEKEIESYLGVEISEEIQAGAEVEAIKEHTPRPIREKVYIIDNKEQDDDEDKTDETIKEFYRDMDKQSDDDEEDADIELIREDEEEENVQSINLELLDIDRNPNPGEIDMVFELPSSVVDDIINDSFIEHQQDNESDFENSDLPENEINSVNVKMTEDNLDPEILTPETDEAELIAESNSSTSINDEISNDELPKDKISAEPEDNSGLPEETDGAAANLEEKEASDIDKNINEEVDENILTELPESIDEIFEEKVILPEEAAINSDTAKSKETDPAKKDQNSEVEDQILEEIINEEPQQSLEFDTPIVREDKKDNAENETFIERNQEPEEANQEFVEYERSLMNVNAELRADFEMMMEYAKKLNKDYAQRDNKIKDIIRKSYLMENLSKELQFEVITNIYQTYRYSFEKISDGKYDISEDTLQLFIKGLDLIISLIKEDNISGYDKQLKDLDKIRKALLSENKKKDDLAKKKKEEEIIESSIQNKYPDHFQREVIFKIRKKILETEKIFNSINEVNSEFILYDRLRLLGGNLNNFKELVQNAKAINLDKLAKLSEGGYILIKYIQNYRIDPSSDEMKDVFSYITYNLKLLVLDKPADDIDVFISYLYDPVKIFTEQKNHEKDNQNNDK
ncbi:hypothetical protein BH10BAC5_BH10BAC5_10620 [soil metagenome]